MTIKTVSQLPEFDNGETIADNVYLGVSYPIPNATNKFMSKKLGYHRIRDDIDNRISSKFKLSPTYTNYTYRQISSIISGDITFHGDKTFDGGIYLNKNLQEDGESNISAQVTNKKYVDEKIQEKILNQPAFIRSNSTVDSWVEPYNGNGDPNEIIVNGENLYNWYMNEGKCTNEVEMENSGNLVIWGYVSAPKVIQTSQCWVAMEGLIGGKWKMLQLHPWIVGSKSAFLQFVGFNAMVAQGLKIRIVTGFQPNLNSSGYGNSGLIYSTESDNQNIGSMNTFRGYVIY